MRAVLATEAGSSDVLRMVELPDPVPAPDEVLIQVAAAGLNRADVLQRSGRYVRFDATDALGLEVAGHVAAVGARVRDVELGQAVCALLAGGGYAEQVAVHERLVIPIPPGLPVVEAAGLPETYLTAYDALILQGGMGLGSRVLVHAGASGVGTAAIQLAHAVGGTVAATCSAAKVERLRALGADLVVDREQQDFEAEIRAWTADGGVDLILDPVGGDYLMPNVRSLRTGGKLIMIETLAGPRAQLDLKAFQVRRLSMIGTTLRHRPLEEKGILVQRFIHDVLPLVERGVIAPVIDRRFSFSEVRAAHDYLEANLNVGKVLLVWD
jgi:putative PIG3 family NAD(P)H quinone oxidoreductase